MKCIFFLVLGLWSTVQDTLSYAQPDDLVHLSGKILDAKTKEPVEAKLKYELQPISNVMGVRFFNNDDGQYQINLQAHRKYTIEVTADDYLPLQLTLQTDNSSVVPQNLLLRRVPKAGDYIELSDTIWFDRGLSVLRPEVIPTIEELKAMMERYPDMVVQLEGHTDRGGNQSLQELSEDRAKAVKEYLVDLGIRKRRIKTKAYGNRQLLTRDDTIEGRQKNRRVEVKILDI